MQINLDTNIKHHALMHDSFSRRQLYVIQHIFAAFLDAIKAFDNLWRQALFLKLKKSGKFTLSTIILL
jgi:hypothetical protein